MERTPAQQRTLEQLIGRGAMPLFDPVLEKRVRLDIETRLAAAGILPEEGQTIWLGKGRLNDRQRCEGLFQAGLLREGPPFEHSRSTAAGRLFHKAIEIDIATERQFDPYSVCERSAVRVAEQDALFGVYWKGLNAFDQADLVSHVGGKLSLFRDSFPPLQRRWASQPELWMKVPLAGGRVVLSGAPDLVLGRGRRLVIDFKTGRAWPEHPEDMRFYSLLLLLRTGVPPYRVATFFLDSGEWQAEDVSDETLDRACERVVTAATTAVQLAAGRSSRLSPGPHCARCPRMASCPAAVSRSPPMSVAV